MASLPDLDPESFPLLTALLRRDKRGTLRRELYRLQRPPRERRRPVNAVARLVAHGIETSVLLKDVSRSGVSCLLLNNTALCPQDLVGMKLLVRTGTGLLEAPIRFVRVVSTQDEWVLMAFSFDGLSAAQSAALDDLGSMLLSDLFRGSRELLDAEG